MKLDVPIKEPKRDKSKEEKVSVILLYPHVSVPCLEDDRRLFLSFLPVVSSLPSPLILASAFLELSVDESTK